MLLLNELAREWQNWHEGLQGRGSCLPTLALMVGGVGLLAGLTQEVPPMANVGFALVGIVGVMGLWVPAWLLSDARLLFRLFARRRGLDPEVVESCAPLLRLRPLPEPLEAYTEAALQAYRSFCRTADLAIWRERGRSLKEERAAVQHAVQDLIHRVGNTWVLGHLVHRFQNQGSTQLQRFYHQRCDALSHIVHLLRESQLHLQEAVPSGGEKSKVASPPGWEALTNTLAELQQACTALDETWAETAPERLTEIPAPAPERAAKPASDGAPRPRPVELQPSEAPEIIDLEPTPEPEKAPRPAWAR